MDTYAYLINENHSLPVDYIPTDLVSLQLNYEPIQLRKEAADALMNVIVTNNYTSSLALVSGFRSYTEQQHTWDYSLNQNGLDYTKKYVALPGCSEHQSGLAIDIGENKESIDYIAPDFPQGEFGNILHQQLVQAGFILRYQKEKEHITHISAEPWHYRYVTPYLSNAIDNLGYCYEEFIEFIHTKHRDNPLIYENMLIYSSLTKTENALLESQDNCGRWIIVCQK